MRGDRPQNMLALALASLALALVLWWAWNTLESPEPELGGDGKSAEVPPGWLEPDPEPEAAPEPAPAVPPSPPPAPAPPPTPTEPPPERIQPKVLPPADEEPAPSEPVVVLPDDAEKEPPASAGFHTDAFRERLLGGVARTSARSTPEVRAPDGYAIIGTPASHLQGLASAARVGAYVALEMEAPIHRVRLDEFFIDRFETRNHEYLIYLNSTARIVYNTSDHPGRTLAGIVEYLVPRRPLGLDVAEGPARQLFHANRLALLAAWKGLVVQDAQGVVDLDRTYERVRDREVPRGLRLVFYDRLPPGTWPGAVYADGFGDHPVRALALSEVLEYALYRGRYIPMEEQWEYAARGPQGLDFPWDARGKDFDFNVNGGREPPRGEEPATRPVTQFPGGTSWIGCFNMLGNVSEWTSSYLDVYPGGVRSPDLVPGTDLVVRGGSADDRERWGLRPALRGWRAEDPDHAPRFDVRRTWTGIRTARWSEPGRSRIPTMHVRARSALRLNPALLDPELFEGWEGEQYESFERVAGEDDRDKPRPGVKSVVVQPLQVLGLRDPRTGTFEPDVRSDVVDPDVLLAGSVTSPVLVGLLHVDMHVLDVWADPDAQTLITGGVPKGLRRADMPPGTYLVGLLNGLVALVSTDLRGVYYPSNRPPPKAILNLLERDYIDGAQRRPTIEASFAGGKEFDASLVVPTHTSAKPGYAVLLRLDLALDPRDTRLIRELRHGRILR